MKKKNKKFQRKSQNPLNKLSLFQKMIQNLAKNVHYLEKIVHMIIKI